MNVKLLSYIFGLLAGVLSLSCSETNEPGQASSAQTKPASAPVALTQVRSDTPNLLFRYKNDAGFATATTIAEIPKSVRSQVQVIDLSLSPAQRRATKVVQVFDLSAPGADGQYPGRFVPRAALESALADAAPQRSKKALTMYSASWCSVCTQARSFLKAQNIPYIEKDIDKDKGAKKELASKARKAGVNVGGVPVFDVYGTIIPGFDPKRILSLVKGG